MAHDLQNFREFSQPSKCLDKVIKHGESILTWVLAIAFYKIPLKIMCESKNVTTVFAYSRLNTPIDQ